MSAFQDGATYRARIVSWATGETSNQNAQISFTVKPFCRVDGDQEYDCPEVEKVVYRVITDKTEEYVIKDLVQLGYDRLSFEEVDPNHPNAFDFKDVEVLVKMTLEDYKGQPKERWNFAWGGGAAKPIERKKIAQLNASFAAKLKAIRAAGKGPATPPRAKTIQQEAEETF